MSNRSKPPAPGLDPASEQLLKELQQGLEPGEDPFYWDIRRNWKEIASKGAAATAAGAPAPTAADGDQRPAQVDIRRLPTESIPLRESDLRRLRKDNRKTLAIAVGASFLIAVPIAYWFLQHHPAIVAGDVPAASACAQPPVLGPPSVLPASPPSTAPQAREQVDDPAPRARDEAQHPASRASRAMAPLPASTQPVKPVRPSSSQVPLRPTRFPTDME